MPVANIGPQAFRAALGAHENVGISGSGACFLISLMFEHTVAKYGPPRYRFSMSENVILTYHLPLSAPANYLISHLCGGYFDEEAHAPFDARGSSATTANCAFVDQPAIPSDVRISPNCPICRLRGRRGRRGAN